MALSGSGRAHTRPSRAASPRFERFLGRSGNQPFAYRLLAGELAGTADRLALFPRRFLRRLLVEPAPLHFPQYAFALHLLLQDAERLIDIVVANEHLQIFSPSVGRSRCRPRSLVRFKIGRCARWRVIVARHRQRTGMQRTKRPSIDLAAKLREGS